MASKNKKESTRSDNDVKSDQKLQAVILTNYDSFSKSFRPISIESPNILMPLMNIPVIEYVIEFLAQNGVEEIFIFCMNHADKLKSYIEKSHWQKTNIKIECVSSSTCFSAGDALRELDSLGVIRSDPFLLMSSDSICNFKLEDAINFHNDKRKDDPNMIMTSIFKKAKSHVKSVSEDLVLAYDAATSQIVIFENDMKSSTCKLPTEILMEHPHIQFTTGLLDCHIDVCSPEVLVQFSDNFDYQDIRKDFIKNEVVNFELGMHIYAYFLEHEYAAQINEPRTYNAITKDIAARWTYPLVSDAQLLHFCHTNYKHVKRCVYFDDSVKVMRSSEIIDSVIGKHSTVSNHSRLEGCTVGKNCHIASHVKIDNSHIWDDVVIEEGVTISGAIVCSNAIVRKSAVIPKGCIIGFGVIIDENVHLSEFSRMYIPSDGKGHDPDVSRNGDVKRGKGIEWNCDTTESDDEDDDEKDDDECNIITGLNKSFTSKSVTLMRSQSIGCNQDVIAKLCRWERALNVDHIDDDNDNNSDYNPENDYDNDMTDYETKFQNMFSDNIADMVSSGYKENHPPENVSMEIKSFKFSQNKTFSDCLRGIVPSLLHVCELSGKTKNSYISTCKTFYSQTNWGHSLLRPFIQSIEDEICVIECIENEAILAPATGTENVLYPSFRFILQILYDSELVSDEALLKWISLREHLCRFIDDSSNNKEIVKLFQEETVQQFVQWVKQIDEDDDDEEEEDDDEDDGDDE